MADPIKVLAASRKASLRLIAPLLIGLGGLLMIGSFAYRIFVRPEWTFDEAQQALWPFFLAGILSLILGWFFDRLES